MTGRWILAPLAAAALLLSACGNDSPSGGVSAGGDLTGVTWILDEASMGTLGTEVPDEARIDITFDGSQVSGRAACNQYGGGYEADTEAGGLSFSDLFSTQMACEEPLMAMETAYLAALGQVTGYQVAGEQAGLVLTGGDAALTFVPEAPVEPLPLEGTTWTLTTIARPETQAVSSTIAGTEVTLLLDGGTGSGSGGCNTYNGPYQAGEAQSLTIGPVASTKKMCEQDISDQEQAYFVALDQVATYAIDGDQLTLSNEAGEMLLQFTGASRGM